MSQSHNMGDAAAPSDVQRLHAFVVEGPKRRDGLRAAIAGRAAPVIARLAGALHDASRDIGADGLADLCRQLEEAGRTHDFAGAAGLISEISRELDTICANVAPFDADD